MSESIPFDTLAYAKRLALSGLDEKQAHVQAEALAELVSDHLATKQDIRRLEKDLKELEMRLTIRLGIMLTASTAVLATLVKLL